MVRCKESEFKLLDAKRGRAISDCASVCMSWGWKVPRFLHCGEKINWVTSDNHLVRFLQCREHEPGQLNAGEEAEVEKALQCSQPGEAFVLMLFRQPEWWSKCSHDAHSPAMTKAQSLRKGRGSWAFLHLSGTKFRGDP